MNIPGTVKAIAEGGEAALKADVVTPYSGPYPPPGSGVHTYIIKVYALNKLIPNPGDVVTQSRADFETAYKSYFVTTTTYTGYYQR